MIKARVIQKVNIMGGRRADRRTEGFRICSMRFRSDLASKLAAIIQG